MSWLAFGSVASTGGVANPHGAVPTVLRRAASLHDVDRHVEARECLAPLFAAGSGDHRMECTIANNLAWIDAAIGDLDLLNEADDASASAIRHDPTEPRVIDTRARVLAEIGRSDEALLLAEQALSADLDPADEGEALATRALARLGRRDFHDARVDVDAALERTDSYGIRRIRFRTDLGSLHVTATTASFGAEILSATLASPASAPTRSGAARALVAWPAAAVAGALRAAGWDEPAIDGRTEALDSLALALGVDPAHVSRLPKSASNNPG